MPYVETPRLRIHYREAGDGLTPIVFLHGNYASSRWWETILNDIPLGYRALATDHRGCGSRDDYSSRNGSLLRRFTIQDLVQDLDDFLTAMNIEQTVLVGHSLGGQIATSFAIRFPNKVIALVLEDTGPAWGITFGSITTPILLPLEIKNRQIYREALRRAGVRQGEPLAGELVDDALSAPKGLYYRYSRASAAWKEGENLDRISAPTLLIWGRQDRVMPRRYANAYLQRISDATLVLIPGAGHSPHLERPRAFEKTLYTFLDKSTRHSLSSTAQNHRIGDTSA